MSQVGQPQPNQPPQQQNQRQQNYQQPQLPSIPIGKIVFGIIIVQQIMNFFAPPVDFKHTLGFMGNWVNEGEKFDMHMNVIKGDQELYVWNQTDITYDYSFDNFRQQNISLTYEQLFTEPYPVVQIALLSKDRQEIQLFNETDIIHMKKKKILNTKNLLFGEENQNSSENGQVQAVDDGETKVEEFTKEKYPHYRSKIYTFFIKDSNVYNMKQLPPPINQAETVRDRNVTFYKPFIDTNQWWLRQKDYMTYNSTEQQQNANFTVELSFDTYWSFKFQMQQSMKLSQEMYANFGMDMQSEGEMDVIKDMLVDNSPYYLAVTFTVSVLHSIFEFLAIKNDASYWMNLKNSKGISFRTQVGYFIQDIVVTLYLFDNTEETSTLILVQQAIQMILTVYKILKICRVSMSPKFPYINLKPKDAEYLKTTDKHDKVAIKYMNIAMCPCLIFYAIYSLIYNEQKGWYSFVLVTLVQFIYMFGFINMTPQLYINYKLKSVEHMPWRTMTYRFFNTIVDDFFAFAISMPWLQRLGCFRDDVIFVIYIYQRKVYKVDKRRTEYGFVQDEVVPAYPQPQQEQPQPEQNDEKLKKE